MGMRRVAKLKKEKVRFLGYLPFSFFLNGAEGGVNQFQLCGPRRTTQVF